MEFLNPHRFQILSIILPKIPESTELKFQAKILKIAPSTQCKMHSARLGLLGLKNKSHLRLI